MTKKQRNMLILVGVLVLTLVGIVVGVVCGKNADKISLTVSVTHTDGTTKDFSIKTDKTILSDALTDEGLIEGHEDTYGLYIDSVDGERVEAANNQAWVFTKDGQYVDTGVSTTPISDGDHYEFFVTTW